MNSQTYQESGFNNFINYCKKRNLYGNDTLIQKRIEEMFFLYDYKTRLSNRTRYLDLKDIQEGDEILTRFPHFDLSFLMKILGIGNKNGNTNKKFKTFWSFLEYFDKEGERLFNKIYDGFIQEDIDAVNEIFLSNREFFTKYYKITMIATGSFQAHIDLTGHHNITEKFTGQTFGLTSFTENYLKILKERTGIDNYENDPALRLLDEIKQINTVEDLKKLKNSNVIKLIHYEIVSDYFFETLKCLKDILINFNDNDIKWVEDSIQADNEKKKQIIKEMKKGKGIFSFLKK